VNSIGKKTKQMRMKCKIKGFCFIAGIINKHSSISEKLSCSKVLIGVNDDGLVSAEMIIGTGEINLGELSLEIPNEHQT
jgi:hypothetical protein